jgi:tyrosyl-tRNA synthetase
VIALLADAGLVASRGEARRLVSQGAVRLDGQPVGSITQTWTPEELDGRLLTVGRRSPVRLQAPSAS